MKGCYEKVHKGEPCQYNEQSLKDFERELEKAKQSDPGLDEAAYRATLKAASQWYADEALGSNSSRDSRFLSDAVDRLNPNVCLQQPGGCERLKASVAKTGYPERVDWAKANLSNPRFEPYAKSVQPSLKGYADRAFNAADEQLGRVKGFQKTSLLLTHAGTLEVLAVVETGLKLQPAHDKLKKLEAAARALLAGVEKQRDATVFASPFHRKNENAVLFSTGYKEPKAEDPAMFATVFKASEPLFAYGYFGWTVGDLTRQLGQSAALSVHLKVDGKEIAAGAIQLDPDDDDYKNAAYTFEVLPLDPAEPPDLYLTEPLVRALAELEPGKHLVEVEVDVANLDQSSSSVAAKGTFTYDNTEGGEKVKAAAAVLAGLVLDAVRMPSPGMKDAAVEKGMMAVAGNNTVGDKPLRAVISDDAYGFVRNEWTGVLLKRTWVGHVSTRGKDGKCMVRRYSFEQPALGGNKFGAVSGMGMSEFEIRCANVNKK